MKKELRTAVIKALAGIKKESDRRDIFYENGIDLINYENGYQIELLNILKVIMEDKYDNISWWLYENVEKIIYFKDGAERDLTKVEDLMDYLMEDMAE